MDDWVSVDNGWRRDKICLSGYSHSLVYSKKNFVGVYLILMKPDLG